MKKILSFCILSFLIISAAAQVPSTFHFQGAIKDIDGIPVNDTKFIEFRIYNAETDGIMLWNEGPVAVEIINGLFSMELGGINPFPEGLFDSSPLYMTFALASGEMEPRQKMLAVPFALKAASSDEDWQISGNYIINLNDSIGIGTANPNTRFEVNAIMRLTPAGMTDSCELTLEGSIYYDMYLKEYCFCDGENWKQLDGGGYCDCVDLDGDGADICNADHPYDTDGLIADCDDGNDAIYPGSPEFCDGIDNDCDPGTVDGFGEPSFGNACDGIDADLCEEGTIICFSGVLTCSDFTGENIEICDGLDNDCNPSTSDGSSDPLLGTPCDGPDNDLCEEGVYVCNAGTFTCTDNTGDNIEICDGIDNDCDGDYDEGPICDAPNATMICQGGSGCAIQSCDPGFYDCNGVAEDGCEALLNTYYLDSDDDGYGDPNESIQDCETPPGYVDNFDDCNDSDPDVNPGMTEMCSNGIDDNCDGLIDCVAGYEDPECACGTGCPDLDSDGYPDDICGGTDCDDSNSSIHPNATEIPDDGVDQDCNLYDATICYIDSDMDGYGNDGGLTILAGDGTCDLADGESSNDLDCNDNDANAFPGQIWYPDCDGDGFFSIAGIVSCDVPTNSTCNGGVPPIGGYSNTLGSDCDDNDVNEFPGQMWYPDCDGDGFFSTVGITSCNVPTNSPCNGGVAPIGGYSNTPGSDCDDEDANNWPGNVEICDDGQDNDCDGLIDIDDPDCANADSDNDGLINILDPDPLDPDSDNDGLCDGPIDVPGYCIGGEDLNADGIVNVNETDPLDADTDDDGLSDGDEVIGGETDPGIADTDNDGLSDGLEVGLSTGISGGTSSSGIPYAGTTGFSGDQDGGATTTDPIDADTDNDGLCDGPSTVGGTCISGEDLDADGAVDGGETNPADNDTDDDGSNDGDDCYPLDNAIYPEATEIWYDGIDQNCDEWNDFDQDMDGYVDEGYPGQAGGTSPNIGDCNDTDPNINPGATEFPDDGIDQNCNGADATVCYIDNDMDGYGGTGGSTVIAEDGTCDAAQQESINDFDCDDANVNVNPGATEIAGNGIDENCDGAEVCYLDGDNDGYRPDGTSTVISADMDCYDAGEAEASDPIGDCNDSDPNISPVATEICDNIDNNCNLEIDEDFDLLNDPNNCGDCDNVCNAPNATSICNTGICGIGSCNPGYGDCDGNTANGCETDLNNDDLNCGACGNDCGVGYTCVDGQCEPL